MPKLSAEARKKISESMRKAWAARRAKQQGANGSVARTLTAPKPAASRNHAGMAIDRALSAIKTLTLGDIQSLAQRKGSVERVTELARLATDLRGLLTPAAKTR